MNEPVLIAIIWAPAATIVLLAVALEVRRRRNPSVEEQMQRAFELTSSRCSKGAHEWSTPWVKGQEVRVYAADTPASVTSDRLPVRRDITYTTTCRHCGEPRAKTISR